PKITNPKGINISELRRFIEQKLPKYMVPEVFVILENLPLNTNGKVDRRALPVPDISRPELEETFVPPRSSTEQILAEIFSQILEVDQVGIRDDFFELGGNSLLLTQLMTQILRNFTLDLTVMDLFEAPNIAALAERIEKTQNKQSFSADLELKKEREEIEL
ncbi:MAG: phosphopantetheine-binding protein, partial [Cyanobacteria bacterium J06639_18]